MLLLLFLFGLDFMVVSSVFITVFKLLMIAAIRVSLDISSSHSLVVGVEIGVSCSPGWP